MSIFSQPVKIVQQNILTTKPDGPSSPLSGFKRSYNELNRGQSSLNYLQKRRQVARESNSSYYGDLARSEKNVKSAIVTDDNPSGNNTNNEDETHVIMSLNNLEHKFFKINRQISKIQDQQDKMKEVSTQISDYIDGQNQIQKAFLKLMNQAVGQMEKFCKQP